MGMAIHAVSAALAAFLALALAWNYGSANGEAVLILACAIFFFALIMWRGIELKGGILSIIFGYYFILLMAFPGMLHAARGWFPFYSKAYPADDVTWASTIVLVFAIASWAGHVVAGRRYQANDNNRPVVEDPVVTGRVMAALVAFGIATVLFGVLGPDTFLARRGEGFLNPNQGVESSELLQTLKALARESAIIGLMIAGHRFLMGGRRVLDLGLVFTGLVINGLVNFPLSISRFELFGNIIVLMHIIFDTTNKKLKIFFAVGMLVMTGTVFPFMSHLQRGNERLDFNVDVTGYFANSGDLDGLQSTINVAMMVDGTEVRWGWQLLSAVMAPVPRAIWPSKGQPTGLDAAAYAGYQFLNISSPLPSEFYVDFGILGVFVGGLLVGYGLAAGDYFYYRHRSRKNIRIVLLFGNLAGFSSIILRGALLGVVAPVALSFILIIIMTSGPFVRTSMRDERPQGSGGAFPLRARWRRRTGQGFSRPTAAGPDGQAGARR